MIEQPDDRSRLDRIRARRQNIDKTVWQWSNPDQREVEPGFWIAYAQGPNHPAHNQAEAEEAYARAARDQALINSLPGDIDYLLARIAALEKAIDSVVDDLEAVKTCSDEKVIADLAESAQARLLKAYDHEGYRAREEEPSSE